MARPQHVWELSFGVELGPGVEQREQHAHGSREARQEQQSMRWLKIGSQRLFGGFMDGIT